MSGWASHQRVRCCVHSRARRTSKTRWQNAIVLQYTMPLARGESSPATTETIVSSRSSRPSSVRPRRISACPCSCTASARRSLSPNREAIPAASAAASWARAGSPATTLSMTAGMTRYPRSTQSASSSSSCRWARANHPRAGPSAPWVRRSSPIQNAQRTARAVSRASRCAAWARSRTVAYSSSSASMYAETARRSRSCAPRGALASASASASYASFHARRSKRTRAASRSAAAMRSVCAAP